MSADDKTQPDPSPAPVGYRRPPLEHRFQKGVSGNPRGRPPKEPGGAEREAKAALVEELLMAEAMRPIQVRENDKVVEMPMIQAVLRGMGVAAVKGSHRAGAAFTQMVTATQNKRQAVRLDFFETLHKYKKHWLDKLEACDLAGRPQPNPVPHPLDIVLDYKTGTVTFNGPFSRDEKAQWDQLLKAREESLAEIEEGNRRLRQRPGKMRDLYETDIAEARQLADTIGGMFPSEGIRRKPGFDLAAWRARNGTLARLEREHRQREKKRRAKPVDR